MPETIKSLKIENDSLKSQIVILQKDFKSFQEAMTRNSPNCRVFATIIPSIYRIARQKKALTSLETKSTI